MTSIKNDNNGNGPIALRDEPDAQGQAALLLAESTLHVLVERNVLTNQSAISAIQSASEVKAEVAAATGESRGRMEESLALLAQIEESFEADQKVRVI